MHGYLDRDELDIRLEEINRVVTENPLLSERAKQGLLYAFVAITFLFLLFIIAFARLFGGFIAPVVVEAINAVAFFVGKYLINEEAKRRSERFSEAISKLFDQYNVNDNPTANWKLKWRNVLSHYKVEMNYSFDNNNGVKAKGKITPKYAEEAEIELEINDALAEVTECTIRLQLCRNNKLRRITKQKEELERLLSSNEDYSVIIDDRKLPKTPPSNYIPPSNNKPRPDNMSPFNNTPRPDNTPPYNNTPRPDNTPPYNNTPRPDNTPPYNNTPRPDNTPPFNNTSPSNNTEISIPSVRNANSYESLNANKNRKMNNINDNGPERMNYANPQMNMRTANSSVTYNPQMSSTYTGRNQNYY
ncbi:hypothetical protein C1646_748269 [Rhizophagus diaphanus]|nr:hypothetical protein C1646_748269 [Rhizophagus diaphanus] [Rhizophagus sp. MUCL 43196]